MTFRCVARQRDRGQATQDGTIRPGAVTDEIWADAARHYDERQLGALVLMASITNFFNRINTTFRTPAGVRWD
jgi:alkylhydroperoxidase family enzyme